MTPEQESIKNERINLLHEIRMAKEDINDANKRISQLTKECKHDSTKTWAQSASGNESYYICDICGVEIE